ncbi:hypothetical protein U1738_04050 [Sphingomonas sp. GB1N7]
MLSTPIAATPAAEAGAIRPYVIVDGPPLVRIEGGKSLGAAISEEVRQRIVERPDEGDVPSSTGAIRLTDFTIADDEDAAGSGDVMDAVIAAHAERISVLKQRMDALRAEGGDSDLVADLRIRLHRAEAARRLAVARANVDKLAAARCGGDADAECRSGLEIVALDKVKVPVASRPSIVSRRMLALKPPAVLPGASPRLRRSVVKTAKVGGGVGARHPLTFAARSKTRVSVRAAGESFRSSRIVIDLHVAQRNPFATRLAHARRSLAVARKLLEAHADHVPRSAVKPILQTVGLWRWPGSEQWSLTSTRSRAA